jgi:proteic killer suppression protein
LGYNHLVIKSFAHKGLEQFFLTGSKAGIQPQHASRIRLILAQLQQARTIEDMRIPTLRLHELKGDRRGTWPVTVQANWRITFRFAAGDVDDVDYEDYH